MCQFRRVLSVGSRLAVLVLALPFFQLPVAGVIRDGGIDPSNLGKGDWIYILSNAQNQLGGNAPAVSNLTSLMIYEKNQGLQYLIIKSAEEGTLYPSAGSPQFTGAVVDAGHAAGLKIFGYGRFYGTDVPGEIAMVNYVFGQGADGFVIDAEGEWESLANNTVVASNLCSSIRTNWPTKFLAHSPFAYIGVHTAFPYKEFGYYCDAAMPQDYWIEFGDTPTNSVNHMNTDWRNWQNGLSGKWTNSIKPIVPIGQGWSGSGTITATQITQFVSALKGQANPATQGGYKGVNYFRAELHPPDVLDAIRTNSIGVVPTNAPIVTNVTAGNITASSATIAWTTDQSSDSIVEYGLTTSYGSATTNTTPIYYHSLPITGLSANTTYHYRAESRNASNSLGVSSDYVFTTLTASVSDVIVESYLPGGTLNSNPPYTDSGFVGSPSTCKSSAPGLTSTDVRYATGLSGPPSCTFKPTLAVAGGTYDVYITHCGSSVSPDVVVAVTQTGCSGLPATSTVFQSSGANTWELVGRMTLNSGVTVPSVKFATNGVGSLSGSARMYSDAIKFVYVPPPPSAPLIATQPQSQTINQGNTVAFTVVASGTAPLTYQWKHAGTNLAGATDSSFTKVNVQPSDAGTYTVGITNSVGSTNGANATLTVNLPPSITAQPQSVTTNAGVNVTFSVTATGTPPLTYRGQLDDADIPGATASSYTRNSVQSGDAGAYSVIVSNVVAAVSSADAVLTVNVPPAITAQPQDQTIAQGSNATFTVTATGTAPLSYQWRFNGSPISGATGSSFTRSNAQTNDAGPYSVVVTNVAGSVTSSNATLTVNAPQNSLVNIDALIILRAGNALLQMSGGPGTFTIDATPDLSDWTQLTSLTATGAVFEYTDPATNQESRFYRVQPVP